MSEDGSDEGEEEISDFDLCRDTWELYRLDLWRCMSRVLQAEPVDTVLESECSGFLRSVDLWESCSARIKGYANWSECPYLPGPEEKTLPRWAPAEVRNEQTLRQFLAAFQSHIEMLKTPLAKLCEDASAHDELGRALHDLAQAMDSMRKDSLESIISSVLSPHYEAIEKQIKDAEWRAMAEEDQQEEEAGGDGFDDEPEPTLAGEQGKATAPVQVPTVSLGAEFPTRDAEDFQVRLIVAHKILEVDGKPFDFTGAPRRFQNLLDLARSRKKASPEYGYRNLGKGQLQDLRAALNKREVGLADRLLKGSIQQGIRLKTLRIEIV